MASRQDVLPASGIVCRIDRYIGKSKRYASDFFAIPKNWMELANLIETKRNNLDV